MIEADCWIRICDQDIALADKIAETVVMRANKKIIHNVEDNAQIRDRLYAHQMGFRGEAAVSRYLNVDWYSPETITDMSARHKGDLEFSIEVKTGDDPRNNLLISKKYLEKLRPDQPVVYALAHLHPTYELMGWILARDFDRFKEPITSSKRKINNCYIVKNHRLKPIPELIKLIAHWRTFAH